MATSFKSLLNQDIQSTRTKLHEAIPITGTIVSGTYSDLNIKNYSHGIFQSVFDYPFLSSSANHILDITLGYASSSVFSGSDRTQNAQKIQIYNQMAQVLVGHDATGSIRNFDEDGNLSSGAKMRECYFVNFARLLTKDEIQKGTFSLTLGVNPTGNTGDRIDRTITITDGSGSNGFKTNSPAGEYGILFVTGNSKTGHGSSLATDFGANFGAGIPCGLLYYQAGIAVLTSSIFKAAASGGLLNNQVVGGVGTVFEVGTTQNAGKIILNSGSNFGMQDILFSSSISGASDGLRNRIQNLSFNNTTELNSTIYMCRANANDFNYSSNPTYVSSSKIRVKDVRGDQPISYITTVGLFSPDNELLAVAKLSEPLKKTPANEFTLRVRLDY
tara:strand:- start:2513 stop:3673 length:1161 start_codon:yes stop_codon:yes gene_type:complete